MSTERSLKVGSKRPQRPVARLDSINNPQPRPAPKITQPRIRDCPNPECREKDTGIEEDGKSICGLCGTVIQELNMVSEVAYGLTGGGQHIVHGHRVGADQAYASRGEVVDRQRAMTSRDVTKAAGEKHIRDICSTLNVGQELQQSGEKTYELAIGGFIQGRRIKSVAAVALYIACRIQKEKNTHMLIDFADVLQLDVFNLGSVYKSLLEHIRLNGVSCIVPPINPEDLIYRFCDRLEFGSDTMRVANDTVRIVQRMSRDWMTPGRRPAGVCGAALILAARMNNYRRTVQEMVYVVKVNEQTLINRLNEFMATESSGLTVEEFRTIDLERTADPPRFTANHEPKDGKKKRARRRKHVEFDDDGDNDQPTVISSRATSATPSNANDTARSSVVLEQQAQIDSRHMPPPPLPVDPSLLESSPGSASSPNRSTIEPTGETKRTQIAGSPHPSGAEPLTASAIESTVERSAKKRGRPKSKNAPPNAVTPPASQRSDDPAVEADITVALTDPLNINHANALKTALESVTNPPSPPATQSENTTNPIRERPPIPDTEEISDSEFADDPEVVNCLLTPAEVAIKTRIWTHENHDWLLKKAKDLNQKRLHEEHGTGRVVVRRKRKRKRMGDMSAYGEEGEEGGPVAGSPAEAVMKMMNRRSYSKKLNYDMLKDLYGGSSSGGSSRRDSVSQGPGEGLEGGGNGTPTSNGRNGAAGRESDNAREGGDDDVHDEDDQQEQDTVAGASEDEGTHEDHVGQEEDEHGPEDDDYDDDPYGGGEYLSE